MMATVGDSLIGTASSAATRASRRMVPRGCRFPEIPFDLYVGRVFRPGERGLQTRREESSDPARGATHMRFMVIVKATKESEAGVMPSRQLLADMGTYNEELAKAGVMV